MGRAPSGLGAGILERLRLRVGRLRSGTQRAVGTRASAPAVRIEPPLSLHDAPVQSEQGGPRLLRRIRRDISLGAFWRAAQRVRQIFERDVLRIAHIESAERERLPHAEILVVERALERASVSAVLLTGIPVRATVRRMFFGVVFQAAQRDEGAQDGRAFVVRLRAQIVLRVLRQERDKIFLRRIGEEVEDAFDVGVAVGLESLGTAVFGVFFVQAREIFVAQRFGEREPERDDNGRLLVLLLILLESVSELRPRGRAGPVRPLAGVPIGRVFAAAIELRSGEEFLRTPEQILPLADRFDSRGDIGRVKFLAFGVAHGERNPARVRVEGRPKPVGVRRLGNLPVERAQLFLRRLV